MIITAEENYKGLDEWLEGKHKVLLVCDSSIQFLEEFNKKLDTVKMPMVYFSDFQPNPLYESVVNGVEVFKDNGCDSIIAVGGGSAIDVAKCIKLYSDLPGTGTDGAWLNERIVPNNILFWQCPQRQAQVRKQLDMQLFTTKEQNKA